MISRIKFPTWFLFIILFFPGRLCAQVLFNAKNMVERIDLINARDKSDIIDENYKGSPYMSEEFEKGVIFYDNKWCYNDLLLRYNIYRDEIEYDCKEKNTIYAFFPSPRINRVIINEDTLKVAKYKCGKEIIHGFFIVCKMGNVNLLKKPQVLFTEAKPTTPFIMEQPAKFTSLPDKYYIEKPGLNAILIKRSKDLCNILKDHQKEINAYIKREKVSARKEDDLVKIIAYYNSL